MLKLKHFIVVVILVFTMGLRFSVQSITKYTELNKVFK